MAIGNDIVLRAAPRPAADLQRLSPRTLKNEQLDDDDEKRRASTAMAIVELLGGAGTGVTGATEWFAQPPLKPTPTTILPSLQPLKQPLWGAGRYDENSHSSSDNSKAASPALDNKAHVLIQPLPSIAQLAANMSVSDRLSIRIPSASAPVAASSAPETKTESSSSATVVPTPTATATATPVSVNHSRKRQKDELDKLRVQVQELQRELEHVRARLPKKPQVYTLNSTGAIGLSNEVQASVPSSVTIWERIASHQKEQKNKSEMENMKLKSMVQEQVKISKALEKLVNKRCKNSSLEAKFAAKRLRVCDSEEQLIFESLSKSLDERYQQVDAVFEKLGMAYQKRERQEANMILDTINGPTMELKDATIFPFDVQSISEAVWRSLEIESLGCKEGNMGMIESLMLQSSEDTVCIKTSIPLRQPRVPESDLSLRCVMKRYVEKTRVIILWESVSDCLAKMVQCAGRGVEVRDRGWCMIESLPSPPGRHSSIIQLCSHIAPRMSGDNAHVSMQHMHSLVDTITPCFRYMWGNRQQIMENLLMENVVGLPRPPCSWPVAAE